MKYIYSATFLLSFLLLSAFAPLKQCNFLLDKDALASSIQGYQYLKSFRIDGKGGRLQNLEYTIVMKQGKQYKFAVRTPEGHVNGIVMKIYDRRSKKRVFTNFSASGLSADPVFTATKTGLYDVRFSFKGSKSYCGIVVCGEK